MMTQAQRREACEKISDVYNLLNAEIVSKSQQSIGEANLKTPEDIHQLTESLGKLLSVYKHIISSDTSD